ncbi:MAG: DUF4160 domain-containing protein [Flavobacterium sp.]|nr:DUF4160 domain-containing protein [Flavobacterium sp.]
MPQISRFFGIIIAMYFNDHNPPHFHAKYGDDEALISIKDFSILEGQIPSRALGMVIEWAALHKDELMANWKKAIENESLDKIEPLK